MESKHGVSISSSSLIELLSQPDFVTELINHAHRFGFKTSSWRPELDGSALSNQRLRLVEVARVLGFQTIPELVDAVKEQCQADYLINISADSGGNGFFPFAQPYDLMVLALLNQRRDHPGLGNLIGSLGFVDPLVDSVAHEFLGRPLRDEERAEKTND